MFYVNILLEKIKLSTLVYVWFLYSSRSACFQRNNEMIVSIFSNKKGKKCNLTKIFCNLRVRLLKKTEMKLAIISQPTTQIHQKRLNITFLKFSLRCHQRNALFWGRRACRSETSIYLLGNLFKFLNKNFDFL